MESKALCIVGAGVSGLAACKHLLERGLRPVVFEASQSIGGVWAKTLGSTRLQTRKDMYQYSDFPWPESVGTFPRHDQVMEYLEAYARRFDVIRHVRFRERVVGLEYVGPAEEEVAAWEVWGGSGKAFAGAGGRGVWHVTVCKENGSTEVHAMNFVVLCLGRYSGLPALPTFPENKGPDAFNGKVIHSMDMANMGSAKAAEFVKGKRIVVVGFLKSALDVAAECADINGSGLPCTMIIRTKRWNTPSTSAWGLPLQYFYFNRFSELLFHKPGEGFILSLLATLLSPLRWFISKLAELYFKKTLPINKYGVVPDHSFFEGLSSSVFSILPEGFYDRVDRGSIVLKNSKSFEFCEDGIIVEGESEPIKADLVIFATGFNSGQKLRSIFTSPAFQHAVTGSLEKNVPLYRDCIHPRIPQMAIIGYSESLANLYTFELMAMWLAHFLDGGFRLPSIRLMEKDVEEWGKYMKKYTITCYKKSSVALINTWYNDQLCKDMGCNPRRKKGLLAEWFLPYGPADYMGLGAKGKKKKKK